MRALPQQVRWIHHENRRLIGLDRLPRGREGIAQLARDVIQFLGEHLPDKQVIAAAQR